MTTSIPEQAQNVSATATKKARVAQRRAHVAPAQAKPAPTAPRAKKAVTARRGTKTAKILDLLKRPGGVTLKELVKATGWQPHSVRGFLSGALALPIRNLRRFLNSVCAVFLPAPRRRIPLLSLAAARFLSAAAFSPL